MGYLLKAILGLALFVGALVLFNVKLIALLETGTCASGNTPYQISQPCPEGTGTDILLLVASIFAGLIGIAIFAFRGNPPWNPSRSLNDPSTLSTGLFTWGAFFTATGATSLIASLTNEAVKDSSGGALGGLIVGITFLVMGAPALVWALWQMVSGKLGGRDERPASASAAGTGASFPKMSLPKFGGGGGTGGQIGKLERLQKLKQSGALTDAEFEREKAKILAE